MNIQSKGRTLVLELESRELYLLRRALERASFIDTPLDEQAEIASFCSRALDVLPREPAAVR
jgi:hypothetical protein